MSPCKSGVEAVMLLWLAMLLDTDLLDEDTTLLAVCIFEKAPIEFIGGAVVVAAAAAAVFAVPVKAEPKSSESVFSPNSQYVVTFPLPCFEKKKKKKYWFSLLYHDNYGATWPQITIKRVL